MRVAGVERGTRSKEAAEGMGRVFRCTIFSLLSCAGGKGTSTSKERYEHIVGTGASQEDHCVVVDVCVGWHTHWSAASRRFVVVGTSESRAFKQEMIFEPECVAHEFERKKEKNNQLKGKQL